MKYIVGREDRIGKEGGEMRQGRRVGVQVRKVKTERWEGKEERKKQCHMGTRETSWP